MDEKKQIVEKIVKMSGSYSAYNIFSDWVECCAISIQNSCSLHKNEVYMQREEMYKKIMNKYSEKQQKEFAEMFALLVLCFENRLSDILGEIYMESGCGNKYTGQFFTPYHLSLLNAKLALPDEVSEKNKIKINEPSCGGGGMIIAAAQYLKEKGVNYQKCMEVVAQDLDWKGVYMCYVQLSLLGIDAVVVQGDTLAEPYTRNHSEHRVLRTPKNIGALM